MGCSADEGAVVNTGAFSPGLDHRRNTRDGRPPTTRTLVALIRTTLGRDAPAIVERLRTQAAAGDPQAISAAAVLLAATIEAGNAAHS